ncbi:hypothetical protein [Halobaculum gomorrense]|uniref:Coiled-coil protein n=1 Tax=Halobaculum gomorrense TaxID=43928 RepID=A0A1M5NUA0_9EURY|nr:hypothetical protein [Halobaculum gomorrense]SHG93015.1 hypothetical protein SAMN05443636_1346 [Halobaculum gomorrense]
MKRQYKAALGIGGIVLATAIVGLVSFLYFGSQVGVYVIGVGAPLVVVAAIGLYVRGVLARDTTSQGDFVQEAARAAAESFRDELTTYNRLDAEYDRWDPGELETRARQIADDFADAGVTVDVAAATISVDSPGRVQEFDKLQADVSAFADDRDQSFAEFGRSQIERARQGARSVSESVLDGEGAPLSTTPDEIPDCASPAETERVLSTAREEAAGVFEDAVDRIKATVDEYDGDAARIDSHLEAARTAIDDGDWDAASAAIGDAQGDAESEVDAAFTADRESIDKLLSTIDSVDVDRYAEDDDRRTVEEARERLSAIDSALASDELDAVGEDVRRAATNIVATLETALETDVNVIREADVPVGFYTAPPAVATDYEARLREADDLDAFREEWLAAAADLTEAVDDAETKASVADSYEMVEERIADGVRTEGRVTGEDLPVRDAEPFLELYAQGIEGVEFDPAVPAVVADGGGESYDVTVTAQLATSTGEEHDLTVELEGEGVSERETASTFVAAEATFDEIPYGEYTATASTPTEGFADAEATLQVAADESVELVLEEVGLRERVCGDDADDVRSQLSTVAPKLEAGFAADEYLTPESDIPVADEYVPCLLVLWAEEEGHEATLDDGRVLVYDHDQFRSRLDTITTHNLSDGETMTYDDMRRKFLSVPASDDLIRTTLGELDAGVDVGDTGVSA